jgi:hypothetical protein
MDHRGADSSFVSGLGGDGADSPGGKYWFAGRRRPG